MKKIAKTLIITFFLIGASFSNAFSQTKDTTQLQTKEMSKDIERLFDWIERLQKELHEIKIDQILPEWNWEKKGVARSFSRQKYGCARK